MRNLSVGIALALTVLFSGILQAQNKTDPALNKLTADFEAAYNAGDAVKAAAMYADDAVQMPPDEQMVKGRSAIEARLKSEMQKGKVTLKLSPSASAISADQAYEAGTATVALPDGRTLSEKYLVVYKRVGGEWKIAYDIWNSNAPPTPKK
ncbi:MAG: nuclear transport factor 2 family protein [Acidobacteria bacterium]|nr:nuclear transport factor 2 family protein [Acidobacteriota bacterium]